MSEKGKVDEETGKPATTLTVTTKQKAEMDAAIDARLADTENSLTEEERATLEALRSMMVAKSSTAAGGETTPAE